MSWNQRTQSLDLLGLDPPFAEAGETVEANTLNMLGGSPFADPLGGKTEWHEASGPAADFEHETKPSHSFKDCTNAQKALLIDATDRALTAVRRAASFVGSAHGRPDRMKPATRQLLLRHFHTVRRDDLRHILTRYMRIAKSIEEGISFEGEKQCQATPSGRVCGYANMTQLFGGFGKVHICFDSRAGHCDFTSFSPDQQEAVVIHEVAHRYVGIDDKAYLHEPKYATLTPKQALDNADSYAFFAVEGSTVLKESVDLEGGFPTEETEASELEYEVSYPAYEPEDESWPQEPQDEDPEASVERCAPDEHFEEPEELSEAPAWAGSADQVAFRSSVLAEHIARSTKRHKGKVLRDLRDDELAKIPGTNVRTKAATAQAAGRLLAAARAALAQAKAAGDADALRTRDISVGSGYRDSAHQRGNWLKYFPGYYNRTRAQRERLPGGPHSGAAVDYMLKTGKDGFGLGSRIAAPGFSNHQNGIAIDFIQDRSSQPVAISTAKANRERWSKTWFFKWLQENAAIYDFEPYEKEEWHWEYKPKKPAAREAEFEWEAAGRTADSPKQFLGGSLWTYRSRACGADVAVFVPPAASGRSKVDLMLYVHGLLSPCGAPKVMPEGLISAAPFKLGQLMVDSGRPMVLVVPRFQPGNDKTWSAHNLHRPDKLNALFAEVIDEAGRRLGRNPVQIDQLVIAGHSRAYGVLYPLARSHASPALATGALSRLSKVWVLDATYGTPPMAAFDALVAARPGVGVDVIYRSSSPTDKFGGRSRSGAVALRPVGARSASHCAVPGKLMPTLIGELPAQRAEEAEMALAYEDERELDADLPRETLDWLDMEADAQEASWESLNETETFEWEGLRTERHDDEEAWASEAVDTEAFESPPGATLRRGSSGPAVAALQQSLMQLGHSPGTVDGKFGANTDRAVRAFQAKSGLTADGVVGSATRAAIAAALSSGKLPARPPAPVTPPAPTVSTQDVDEFATRLGAEWSKRKGGKPSADEKRQELLRDHEDTLKGARLRFGTRYPEDAIRRAWMASREDQMRFDTELSGTRLADFNPPATRVGLISDALIPGSEKAPVAPIMVRFVNELRRRYGATVTAKTYRGHGGNTFRDRGYSLDIYINGQDSRGFYPRDAALRLLRAVNEAAAAMPARWRIIYNDFAVADAMNRETGRRNVIFVGQVRRDKTKGVMGLNWHGPHPLILHFHLDLVPQSGAEGESWSEDFSESEHDEVQCACDGEAPSDETIALEGLLETEAGGVTALADRLKGVAEFMFGPNLARGDGGDGVRSLQRALAVLGASLDADGTFGAQTERAVRDFQARSGMEVDGIVGPATKTAIGAALGGHPTPSPAQIPSPPPSPSTPPRRSGKKLTPKQFVAAFGAMARASEAKNRVPALVTLGQAALESGWGASAPRFNFFGIKAKATDPESTRQLLRTKEVFPTADKKFPNTISITPRPDGRYTYVIDAWFRAYPDAAAAFNDHGEFLVRNKRYSKAFTVLHDPYAFAAEVARAGYATDPSYERILTQVMRMIEAAGEP